LKQELLSPETWAHSEVPQVLLELSSFSVTEKSSPQLTPEI